MNKKIEIQERLAMLVHYAEELQDIGDVSWSEYENSVITRRAVERLIMLLVECAFDINQALFYDTHKRVPQTYSQAFEDLPQLSIVSGETAEKLATISRLRNRLVHDYGDISDLTIYNDIQPILKAYTEYIKAVHQYLLSTN